VNSQQIAITQGKLKHSKSLHFFNSLIVDKDEEEDTSPGSKKQIKLEIVTNS